MAKFAEVVKKFEKNCKELAKNADISIFKHSLHEICPSQEFCFRNDFAVLFSLIYSNLQFHINFVFQSTTCTSEIVSKLEQSTNNRRTTENNGDNEKSEKFEFLFICIKKHTKFRGCWSIHLRITTVSSLKRCLKETLEIEKQQLTKLP